MKFTISNIAPSLADHLAPVLPGVTFYEDPVQQGSDLPCCFLQQRSAKIAQRIGNRYLRTIRLDLTYLDDYNLPDLQRRYESAAEILDEVMETFSYSVTESGVVSQALLRTYDRQWSIDLDALHYRFELRVWVYPDETIVPMGSLEVNEEVKGGSE